MKTIILESGHYSDTALEIYRSLGQVVLLRDECPIEKSSDIWDAEIWVVRLKYRLDRALLEKAKSLKYIVSPTTGLDHIDRDYAKERGIDIISLKGETEYLDSIVATAELTWGLLLSLTRNIPFAYADVIAGDWNRDQYVGFDLRGKTIGILGYGRIGKKIAVYAKAFGMRVLTHDIREMSLDEGISLVSKEVLFRESDMVSVHLPLEENTVGYVDACCIDLMNPESFLLNTSRGKIIDETALLKALEDHKIKGAAVDVLSNELSFDKKEEIHANPLVSYAKKHENLLITPHIGGASYDAMRNTEVFVARKLLTKLEK